MSRPERFDLSTARRLETAAPLGRRTEPPICPADRPGPCETCPDELRCPFRALARLLAG